MAKKESQPHDKFEPFLAELKKLAAELKKQKWASDWSITAGLYGKPKVRGAMIRMHKKAWPELLHFESWIGNADIERGSVSTAFHIETSLDTFAVRRNELNQLLIENGASKMKEWDGFSLSPKSFQPIKCHTAFDGQKVAGVLKPLYKQLQRLGDVIDNALNIQ